MLLVKSSHLQQEIYENGDFGEAFSMPLQVLQDCREEMMGSSGFVGFCWNILQAEN